MSRGRRSKARQAIESIRSVGRARGTIVRVSELTPPVRVRPRFVALVGTLAAVPAITTDMFLPQLPDIARDLGTTTWAVQLTVTMMLVGGAVGQLVNGPLSDTLGRRRPALWGLTIHVVLSLACAAAPSIGVLVALRTAQGFFNAAASVVALAVNRDRFSGPTASRLLSRLMLVIGVAPLFAPTIGTWVGGIGGWRGVFVALAVFGAAAALWWIRRHTARTFLRQVWALDWGTGFFIIGIFVVVGALTEVGLVDVFARALAGASGGSVLVAYTLLVWGSVAGSAFIDNVPFVAAMLPVCAGLAARLGAPVELLAFGMVVGASVGGNITPIGASANIVTVGLLRKQGHRVSFWTFCRIGIPFTLVSVAAASLLVWLVWGP